MSKTTKKSNDKLKLKVKKPISNDSILRNFDVQYLKYILIFLLAFFIYEFIMNAWLGDDAYITFRTVDNFVNGYGLTWNTFERVQAYTHPLWMFLHIPIYFAIDNIYITTIILSFGFSFATLYILMFKISDNRLFASIGVFALLCSKVFIDYTSSGLENPLSYFIAVLYIYYYFKEFEINNKLLILSLLASLATLNRMDTLLIYLPSLMFLLITNWNKRHFLSVFIGFIPFILWEIFSIVYYGFPFPNTYYAKLNTGIPFLEYVQQGFAYYSNLLRNDLMTALIIFIGIIFVTVFSFQRKTAKLYIPIILGVVFYLLYILRIGGDFMSGRFFSVPFLFIIAIATTLKFDIQNKKIQYVLVTITGSIILLGFFTSYHPMLASKGFGTIDGRPYTQEETKQFLRDNNLINDERGFYYPYTSLIKMYLNGNFKPTYVSVTLAEKSQITNQHTYVNAMIGMLGFYSGSRKRIIDIFGLSEPLLARLNTTIHPDYKGKWRIGHFYRSIPIGYFETIESGKNQIVDKNVHKLYNIIKGVTQSNIFSFDRFVKIWKLNTGYFNYLSTANYRADNKPQLSSGDYESYRVYLHRLGHYYLERKQYENSLNCLLELTRDFNKLLKANNTFYTIYGIADIYWKLNNRDFAFKYCNLGIKYSKTVHEQTQYYLLISKIYENEKNYQKSLEILSKYSKEIPDNGLILLEYAHIHECLGSYNLAMDTYNYFLDKLVNRDKLYVIYQKICNNYYQRKMYDSAAKYADIVIAKGGKIDKEKMEFLRSKLTK